MTNSSFLIKNVVDEFFKETQEDSVGMWQVVHRLKNCGIPQEDVRDKSIVVIRIQREWDELGDDPAVDHIAWFDRPR